MSVDSNLIHRCDIERPTVTEDDLGADVPDYATWETDVHCRLVIKEQTNIISMLAEGAFVATFKLILPARIDVTEGDRITNLVFEDGATDPGPYKIKQRLPRRSHSQHHITLVLEQVANATARRVL